MGEDSRQVGAFRQPQLGNGDKQYGRRVRLWGNRKAWVIEQRIGMGVALNTCLIEGLAQVIFGVPASGSLLCPHCLFTEFYTKIDLLVNFATEPPKQMDFNEVDESFIQSIASKRNNIPRKSLNYKTPIEVFLSHICKEELSNLI